MIVETDGHWQLETPVSASPRQVALAIRRHRKVGIAAREMGEMAGPSTWKSFPWLEVRICARTGAMQGQGDTGELLFGAPGAMADQQLRKCLQNVGVKL